MSQDMNILMIGTDLNLLREGSGVRERSIHYASMLGKLDIIVFGASATEVAASGNIVKGGESAKSGGIVQLAENCFVHPVRKSWKFLEAFTAIKMALKIADRSTIISVQDPFEVGLLGLFISRIKRCALHAQVHIDFFNPYFKKESLRQRIQAMIAGFVLKHADGVRVVSKKIKDYVIKDLGVREGKVTFVPVFVDTKTAENSLITSDLHKLFPEFTWIVLVAARYVKQKNIPLAISAFDEFKKNIAAGSIKAGLVSAAGLVIAGSGPEEASIRRFISEKSLDDSVKLGSWTKEFASCMKTCDVFLMSSDYEGYGMTVVEAASLGKSIIMTDVGCAGDFLVNENNGLVVPVGNAAAMAQALARLFNDRAFSEKIGLAAKASTKDTSRDSSARNINDQLIVTSWKTAKACVSMK